MDSNWFDEPVDCDLIFQHPLQFIHKLHTSGKRYIELNTNFLFNGTVDLWSFINA